MLETLNSSSKRRQSFLVDKLIVHELFEYETLLHSEMSASLNQIDFRFTLNAIQQLS